jgi:hypothetical protein
MSTLSLTPTAMGGVYDPGYTSWVNCRTVASSASWNATPSNTLDYCETIAFKTTTYQNGFGAIVFDTSSIGGATITSATLSLNITQPSGASDVLEVFSINSDAVPFTSTSWRTAAQLSALTIVGSAAVSSAAPLGGATLTITLSTSAINATGSTKLLTASNFYRTSTTAPPDNVQVGTTYKGTNGVATGNQPTLTVVTAAASTVVPSSLLMMGVGA